MSATALDGENLIGGGMEDLFRHLETLGVSLPDSPAAADYAKTGTKDELHYTAGEHLALHATSITMALRLPKRGSAVLGVLKHLATSSWQRHWVVENDAFCISALLDLCTVRTVFREEKRWPELSQLLDHVFVTAGVYRCRLIEMSSEETEQFRHRATAHLTEFQDDARRTPEQQMHRLMSLDGVRKERIDMPAFIKAAITERSWVDPWALIRHHDRIAARQ